MRPLDAVILVRFALASFVAGCGSRPSYDALPPADAGSPTIDASPAQDAANLLGSGQGPCSNLTCQEVDCASQDMPETTISGIVFDPAGKNPLYNVIVYIPNAPVQPLPAGATCDACGALASGSPIVTALTGPDGRFTLTHVPTGGDIPLVMQLGKWRKRLVVPFVAPCQTTYMADPSIMRLPAKQSEGDMPQIAISTGGCDPFECLLLKIGIDPSEFTEAGGPGKVHVYQGTGGAYLSETTTPSATLWASPSLASYDMMINACECGEEPAEKPQSSIDNMVAYANAGGRLFNTHYHYYWIDPTKIATQAPVAANPAWQSTASFEPEQDGTSSIDGYIDETFPKGAAFAQWLFDVGGSTDEGIFPIDQARYNAQSANPPSTQWVNNPNTGETAVAGNALLHYTFNTPVGVPPSLQCGKVLYSDFHVVSTSMGNAAAFPKECAVGPMSPQELALEFMLFDLSACIQQDTQPPQPPPPNQ